MAGVEKAGESSERLQTSLNDLGEDFDSEKHHEFANPIDVRIFSI